MRAQATARRNGERGAVAVMAAILISLLIGFLALSLNVGIMMESRGQLQNASDAAALAAARALNGQASGLNDAIQAAIDYSQRHVVYGSTVSISNDDVTFGRWELDSTKCNSGDCFFPFTLAYSTMNPRQVTAVKINNGRDGFPHNDPITLPFGAFVGADTAKVRSAAVAVGAGSADVNCALPLAVAECRIVKPNNELDCNNRLALVMSTANDDTLGFANMIDSLNAPGGNWSAGQIDNGACNNGTARAGKAKLQNGKDWNQVADAIRGWDNGNCLFGTTQTMAVTDAGCPDNPIFDNTTPIVGFVQVTIVGVTDNQGTSLACPDKPAPDLGSPPKSSLVVEVLCSGAPAGAGEWGGGRAYNTGVNVRLVQ